MSSTSDTVVHHHAHHFNNADHEFVTCKQGMWLFLLQEVLFFSPLFVAFFIFRGMHLEAFSEASSQLDWVKGGINTVVLIVSSFFVAMGVRSAQTGDQGRLKIYLWGTMLCAAAFLVVKYFEYTHKIHAGTLPAGFFEMDKFQGALATYPAGIFFSLYFVMTGLHGLHVVGGMIYLAYLIYKAGKGSYGPKYYTPVEMFGLYWHFVDLVWIYLFPLLYLVG